MRRPESRRKAVAHHEAAHAVMVVAYGYTLKETFVTNGTTTDGEVGGWTGWLNPLDPLRNPNERDFDNHAEAVAVILYSGQSAERVLSEQDPSITLPDREPNWDCDDSEADKLLHREPLVSRSGIEEQLRSKSLGQVRRFWHIIVRVAALLEVSRAAGTDPVLAPYLPTSPVIRHADVATLLRPVDAELHESFNADGIVLRHEMAHLVVWFLHGGGIGPLRFVRDPHGLLVGAVRVGPRSDTETETTDFVDSVAERLLAGEIAARMFLDLCDWHVSVGHELAVTVNPDMQIEQLQSMCDDRAIDVWRFLSLASQHHRHDWWSWMNDLLLRTRTIVRNHRVEIDVLATRLERIVPIQQGVRRVPGTDLIAWAYDIGLKPLLMDRPPVELVPSEDMGTPGVRLRRWWRSWGRHAIKAHRLTSG